MSNLVSERRTCAVCCTSSEYRYPRCGTDGSGRSPALDEGPCAGERSTMDSWVETCPSCGYCADDIAPRQKVRAEVVSMVRSPRYQELLHRGGSVSLANRFLCEALLQEVSRRLADQAVALIRAAWAAESAGEADLARQCRSDAADLLLSRRPALQRFTKYLGSGSVVLIDLLRRADRIDEALREVDAALQRPFNFITEMLLAFERQLCERGDTAEHTEAEAFLALTGERSSWAPEPEYDTTTAAYLLSYCGEMLTPHESTALQAHKVRTLRGVMWNTGDAVALKLLEGGKDALLRAIEQRLLAEHPAHPAVNRCPRCGGLARTPQAKQCRHCGHSWRS
ncbi:hypothetical protein [Vitiosangium sp. GDMCC 1.1324]|uniref:hypothetical protein n=1 Tax=Vitiosangium sp. (strain GDMCC 1.1324) TaxID=2138576 RepID=UPI000D3BB37D|nr:hypothetical protein [Vitiosangium sp. GDMCC 1.1324]PTL82146.1 hypothetical protein DAT35_20320 [Vitiosangium sp. GDMCC 1.1324]